MMPTRLPRIAIGLWLGVISCSPANAQVDKLLGNVVSWVLQKQIDEWDQAHDTSRGLTEYNARDNFSAGNHFSPGDQPKYEGTYESRGIARGAGLPRPVVEQAIEPPAQ